MLNDYIEQLKKNGFIRVSKDISLSLLKANKKQFFKLLDCKIQEIKQVINHEVYFFIQVPFEFIQCFNTDEIVKTNTNDEHVMCITKDSEHVSFTMLSENYTELLLFIIIPKKENNHE